MIDRLRAKFKTATDPADRKSLLLQIRRAELRHKIQACELCRLRTTCTKPVPFSGPSPSPLALVLPAPGKVDDAANAAMVGPLSQVVRAACMEYTAWDPRKAFVCYATACRPPNDRDAAHDELKACRANLEAQLQASGARVVGLIGGIPFLAFAPDKREGIMRHHGVPFMTQDQGRVYVPILHPNYLSQAPNKLAARDDWEQDWKNLGKELHRDIVTQALKQFPEPDLMEHVAHWFKDLEPKDKMDAELVFMTRASTFADPANVRPKWLEKQYEKVVERYLKS